MEESEWVGGSGREVKESCEVERRKKGGGQIKKEEGG